ncbi:MAG: hypothetical protein AAF636_01870 [Pseudomonadota bacterium]
MQRLTFPVLGLAVISGCAPQVPDSAYGVGFGDTPEAQLARDAALEGNTVRVPDTFLPPASGTPGGLPPTAEQTAAETTRILAQTSPTGSSTVRVAPATSAAATGTPNNPGISRENDFEVVSARESIESDAARLADNRAQYQVVEPEALPKRSGDSQPNIVAFALSTDHPVGTPRYARAGLNGEARAVRNCAEYASPDQAQIDFLARGGPERDRRGIDPDGDGYACAWNPAPFRKAQQG